MLLYCCYVIVPCFLHFGARFLLLVPYALNVGSQLFRVNAFATGSEDLVGHFLARHRRNVGQQFRQALRAADGVHSALLVQFKGAPYGCILLRVESKFQLTVFVRSLKSTPLFGKESDPLA